MRDAVVLLPLHSPVLEPDLYLPLGEVQHVRHLDAPATRQVAVEVKLFFQFQRLVTGVGRPRALVVRSVGAVYNAHEYTSKCLVKIVREIGGEKKRLLNCSRM